MRNVRQSAREADALFGILDAGHQPHADLDSLAPLFEAARGQSRAPLALVCQNNIFKSLQCNMSLYMSGGKIKLDLFKASINTLVFPV